MKKQTVDGGIEAIGDREWRVAMENVMLSGRIDYKSIRVLITPDTEIAGQLQVFDAVRIQGIRMDSETVSALSIAKLRATDPLSINCKIAEQQIADMGLPPEALWVSLAALQADHNRAVEESEKSAREPSVHLHEDHALGPIFGVRFEESIEHSMWDLDFALDAMRPSAVIVDMKGQPTVSDQLVTAIAQRFDEERAPLGAIVAAGDTAASFQRLSTLPVAATIDEALAKIRLLLKR